MKKTKRFDEEKAVELGSIIRNIRIERGLGRTQLAEKCGLSRASICKIENGQRYPKAETISVIANVLGVRIKDLVGSKACPMCGHVLEEVFIDVPEE